MKSFRIPVLTSAVLLFIAPASMAGEAGNDGAAVQCAPRAEVVRDLSPAYASAPSAVGQIDPTMVIEVYRARNGAFTIISTDTKGQSCVVAVGQNWQDSVTLAGAES